MARHRPMPLAPLNSAAVSPSKYQYPAGLEGPRQPSLHQWDSPQDKLREEVRMLHPAFQGVLETEANLPVKLQVPRPLPMPLALSGLYQGLSSPPSFCPCLLP